MSGTYVTDSGFVKKTLSEIKEELEDEYTTLFGSNIDLDSRGPFGQLIALSAKREADLWDAAEEIYTSRNPSQATGVSLDAIVAENGVTRLPATYSVIQDVLLYGDEGTTVPSDSQARQPNVEDVFALDDDVTIDRAYAREVLLSLSSVVVGTVYSITIDSTVYSYTALSGDTVIDVLNELQTLIEAGTWAGAVTVDEDEETIQLSYETIDFSADWSNLTLDELASGGNFTCLTAGAITVPADTLTIIVTSVTGWDSVNNPSTGTIGTETETDESLRIRRIASIGSGYATDDSIKSRIQDDVDGVIGVSVTSNRTDVVDSEGRPAHSFEAVVSGGDDTEIAEKIWEVQPAGVQSYGNVTVAITDSEGESQDISFSRANSWYIWVRVSRDFNSEEEYPDDGDTAIKEAIVAWALENLDVGDDVIRQRLSIPIYTVSGIGDILIELDGTASVSDTPTYAEQNIEISSNYLADFDTSRITVQDLT